MKRTDEYEEQQKQERRIGKEKAANKRSGRKV